MKNSNQNIKEKFIAPPNFPHTTNMIEIFMNDILQSMKIPSKLLEFKKIQTRYREILSSKNYEIISAYRKSSR